MRYQSQKSGSTEAFVAKVAAGGASLSGSTYLGGAGDDRALAIVVDTAVSAPAPAAGPLFYGLLAVALGAGLIVLSRRRSSAH